MYRFAYDGGHVQSMGYRTAGNLKKSVENDVDGFRKLILDLYTEDLNLRKWWEEDSTKFKGFGKGIKSILLFQLFPNKYPIFNNKSWETFQQLELIQTRMTKSELSSMNEVMNELGIFKRDFLELAFENFIKLSNQQRLGAFNYLEFDRIKTDAVTFMGGNKFIERIDKNADKLNLKRTQYLRLVILSFIHKSN